MAGSYEVPVTTRSTGLRLWFQQARALLKKNAILAYRNLYATILLLSASLWFIFVIWLIDEAVSARQKGKTQFKNLFTPTPMEVPGIPECETGYYIKTPCYDFLYSINGVSEAEAIVENIRKYNPGRPIPPGKVKSFTNEDAVNAWLSLPANNKITTGVLHFLKLDGGNIGFGLQTNSTTKQERNKYEEINFKFQVPLQVAAEREITRYYLNGSPNLKWTPAFTEFAHPTIFSFSIVGFIAPTFLFAASMFSFVLQMSTLVADKENKLRQAMATMGLLDSVYWTTWLFWEMGLAVIYSLLLVLFGMMFQFDFFLNNSFFVLFFVFFLFQVNMTGFAFLLSTFQKKTATSVIVGFAVFLLGFLTQLVVVSGVPYAKQFQKQIWVMFSIFPPNLLAIALKYLGDATSTKEDPGISWAGRKECSFNNDFGASTCVLTMHGIYSWLIGTFCLWLVLALYLDNVLPDVNGVRKTLWFFLSPSYWTGRGAPTATSTYAGGDIVPDDEDVIQEMNLVKEQAKNGLEPGTSIAIRVQGLQKWFGGGIECQCCFLICCKCKKSKPFQAVKGSYFNIEQDKLFCLLGPNGAGKTTTFNCLTGIIPVTSGDALVYGDSIRNSSAMTRIRRYMGVCPQFDILWNELSGREHLRLFANIKGLPANQIEDEAVELLEKVKLTEAGNMRSSSYSGGMKRRLSVAIALIGDPKVVYLDEPTTGMDPISRRYVWDIIEAAKKGRAIILTTHSMEEADILGDRIGIMAKGMLRCLGTSIHLKSRFGAGYVVNCGFRTAGPGLGGYSNGAADDSTRRITAVKKLFKDELGVEPAGEDKSYLRFMVPREKEPQLAGFFKMLKERKTELGITDVQLSLSTLEEVFLNIARQAELETAQAEGRFEMVTLDNGTVIRVPIGAQFVGVPGTATAQNPMGFMVEVYWQQDDTGTLRVSGQSDLMPIPEGGVSAAVSNGGPPSRRLSARFSSDGLPPVARPTTPQQPLPVAAPPQPMQQSGSRNLRPQDLGY
eukprot:TRINITY_DN5005_c0_g1_i1.p1 TRINITY_DN5005_c0_g1~~TRINITY_DN5005_c0_g1_i1.p1  ORF type:complete len:1006 (-),score=193.03 TRINITY_DN5005_c0_g1_i1:975-3992(-)